MPKPEPRESLSAFTERYMSSKEAKKSFPKRKQRYAVMRSEYSREKRA